MNPLKYSEQFDNIYWTKTLNSITANSTIAPDGTMTADKLTSNGADSYVYKGHGSIPTTTGNTYTVSTYVKADTLTTARLYTAAGTTAQAEFTLTGSGSVSMIFNNSHSKAAITALNDGWYRVSMTFTALSSSISLGFYRPSAIVGSFFAWGMQLESAQYTTPYQKTE